MADNELKSVVLVTGASSGIGRAVAIELSQTTALLLGGQDAARLESTRLACARPDAHVVWPCDLSLVGAVSAQLEAQLRERQLRVTGLVHCAGVVDVAPLRSSAIERSTLMWNVNVLAAVELLKPLTRQRANGDALTRVVLISSIFAHLGAKAQSVYAATKGAVLSLGKSLAVELAPRVRVNAVSPGGVPTPMSAAAFADPQQLERMRQDYPLGTGTPEDVARAVKFLMSDESSWMTGQELVVDGGRTLL